MKSVTYGSSERKMIASSTGRGLICSRFDVSACATSQSCTGYWLRRLCVMSG